ncbi:ribokinase [Profundibacterium mesophilum]|uniref:Ribokinase n=1 Tax=Profundibacterium mesophilum KAUST100406-0324 TaxID=1037889 RepID=A0A921TBY0_9RHOB|nr:ribokinase [Profundibacterium mesophilum]KAF0676395.1 Ribokinase [Profundibacterium mesophilum KAUST100406-0324]
MDDTPNQAADVVVLGIFVADTTYTAARMPRMGETIMGTDFALGPGGKGSNQAVAAGRSGARTHLVTRIGRDAFGEMAERVWAEAGVTPRLCGDGMARTGAANIFIDAGTGDNAIIVFPGAGAGLCPDDLEECRDLLGAASVFLTQLEQPMPAAERGLRIARQEGTITILNPAPAPHSPLPGALLELCDYVTPNETEAEALSGIAVSDIPSAAAAAAALRAQGAGAVVITLGAMGALLSDAEGETHMPAHDAGPVRETTGAGDAFNGAFAAGLASGMAPRAALARAVVAAGISVTRPGAAASMANAAEIDKAVSRRPL